MRYNSNIYVPVFIEISSRYAVRRIDSIITAEHL